MSAQERSNRHVPPIPKATWCPIKAQSGTAMGAVTLTSSEALLNRIPHDNVCILFGARVKQPEKSQDQGHGVLFHIELICPPIYIQHNQCPCRGLVLPRETNSVVTNYDTEIDTQGKYSKVIWPCNEPLEMYHQALISYNNGTSKYLLISSSCVAPFATLRPSCTRHVGRATLPSFFFLLLLFFLISLLLSSFRAHV